MEGFKMEDGDADVSIEQTIEIEVAAGEEVEETVELEESISESEDVAEETEQMLATLEFAAHAEAVVEEFGWSRPVAAMLNRGQNVEKGIQGDLEVFLGITMPANESLDMVSSAYDDNTVAALETFKETMQKFWKWIKEQAVKIKNFFVNMWNRLVSFFMGGLKASKRYAELLKKADIDDAKMSDRKIKLVPYASFSDVAGVVTKAISVVDSYTAMVAKYALAIQTNDDIVGNSAMVDGLTGFNTLKEIFPEIEVKDGKLSVSRSDFKKKFEAVDATVSANGWDKTKAMDIKAVEACAKAADKIKANPIFNKALKSIEASAVKFTKITEGNDAGKAAKKNYSEFMSYLGSTQKLMNLIAKFLSHVVRQFIRGQRAVLSCRK